MIIKGRESSIHRLNIDVVSYAVERVSELGWNDEDKRLYSWKPTLPSSSSRDVCSPGEMVLGVDVPLQDPFTPISCGNVIESGEHS